jgi:hypothetical protein
MAVIVVKIADKQHGKGTAKASKGAILARCQLSLKAVQKGLIWGFYEGGRLERA